MNKKQLKLSNFCKEFDIPRSTIVRWIHNQQFPAYNLCGHWYVDVAAFYKWRDEQHSNKI